MNRECETNTVHGRFLYESFVQEPMLSFADCRWRPTYWLLKRCFASDIQDN
jgi:hypothetical protein